MTSVGTEKIEDAGACPNFLMFVENKVECAGLSY